MALTSNENKIMTTASANAMSELLQLKQLLKELDSLNLLYVNTPDSETDKCIEILWSIKNTVDKIQLIYKNFTSYRAIVGKYIQKDLIG
jgi:hypothetical protein